MNCTKEELLLYAVTDRSWLHGRTLKEQVKEALDGGVTFLQLREKHIDSGLFLQEAQELKDLCKQYQVPFVINDDVELALKVDADGVHVGKSDMKAGEFRKKLGKNKIIGVSAQNGEQAVMAEKHGAEYLEVRAVFPTSSKDDAQEVDYETLKAICQAVQIPVIAIGGINAQNVERLKGSGICGVAVISAIFAQEDIKEAAKELKNRTKEATGI